MTVWVTVMGVSRIYLGRHFPGDVLGGFGAGVIVTAIGIQALNLGRFSHSATDPGRARRIVRRVVIVAAGLVAAALVLHVPDLQDASRFLGLALGVMLLMRGERVADGAPVAVRAARVALAALLFGGAWWGVSHALDRLGDVEAPVRALAAGAVPAAILLPGAVFAVPHSPRPEH
jgi:hypothetical protein